MGIYRDVNVKITGRVPDDCDDKDYQIVIAKLRVICAEYGLDLED